MHMSPRIWIAIASHIDVACFNRFSQNEMVCISTGDSSRGAGGSARGRGRQEEGVGGVGMVIMPFQTKCRKEFEGLYSYNTFHIRLDKTFTWKSINRSPGRGRRECFYGIIIRCVCSDPTPFIGATLYMLPNYAETTEYGRNRDHHDHRILQAFRIKINF